MLNKLPVALYVKKCKPELVPSEHKKRWREREQLYQLRSRSARVTLGNKAEVDI